MESYVYKVTVSAVLFFVLLLSNGFYQISSKSIRSFPKSPCKVSLRERTVLCRKSQLTTVPKCPSPDIQRLDCSYNRLKVLLNSSFIGYTGLKYLVLKRNHIAHIETGAFYPLKNLLALDLSSNVRLVRIKSEMFKENSKLTTLTLFNCGLEVFPNDTLKWLPNLRLLEIFYNHLTFLNISVCPKVDDFSLFVAHNLFPKLNEDVFHVPCRINSLALDFRHIPTVDPWTIANLQAQEFHVSLGFFTCKPWTDFFTGLERTPASRFTISNGKFCNCDDFYLLRDHLFDDFHMILTEIRQTLLYPYCFKNLNRVKKFSLIQNEIMFIEPEYFEGMERLSVLKLSTNVIHSVNPKSSIWNLNLSELYLDGNNLREIRSNAFNGLWNLTILDFSFNTFLTFANFSSGLRYLEKVDFTATRVIVPSLNAPRLHKLSLWKCNYFQDGPFKAETFINTKLLENIQVVGSSLRASMLWDVGNNISVLYYLSKLQTLVLSENPLYDIPLRIFEQTNSLKVLVLSRCKITKIGANSFKGLSLLRTLRLENNKLQLLGASSFQHLGNLRNLNLSMNFLVSLGEGLFSNTPLLTNLFIADNQFVSLSDNTFDIVKSSLVSIDISRNPLDCNCDIKWLVEWLGGSLVIFDQQETICASAPLKTFVGKPIMQFHPNAVCSPSVLLTSILLSFIVIIVITVIIYQNRWFLRNKMFHLRMVIRGYKRMEDARNRDDFEFDLNIMFTDADEEWAREILRPAIEERLQDFNRISFGDEDLTLGMYYVDAVHNVVEQSFKTIILFSRAAVQDNWFLIKSRTAIDYQNNILGENVIVVFTEDIPDNELPYMVRLYLSNGRPYLSWVEDERGREYFWNEFIKTAASE